MKNGVLVFGLQGMKHPKKKRFPGKMKPMASCSNNLFLRQRAIVVSIYLDYLLAILSCVNSMSITKLLVLMFLSKSIESHGSELLNGRYSKHLIERATCAVSGNYESFLYELQYSVEAIEIAAEGGFIVIEDSLACLTGEGRAQDCKVNNPFIPKLICEVASLDDKYVLSEMIRNV